MIFIPSLQVNKLGGLFFFSFVTILQFPKALERPEYVAGRVKSFGLWLLSAIFHHHQIETSADIFKFKVRFVTVIRNLGLSVVGYPTGKNQKL